MDMEGGKEASRGVFMSYKLYICFLSLSGRKAYVSIGCTWDVWKLWFNLNVSVFPLFDKKILIIPVCSKHTVMDATL